MGEDPALTFAFGAPGLDALEHLVLLEKEELEACLQFDLHSPVAMVTYHPVTLENDTAEEQVQNLLVALLETGVRAVFTKANADSQGRLINQKIAEFCLDRPRDYCLRESLGQRVYLSCLRHVDLMIGNSSSGLIEAPSLGLSAVNIGDRQRGRIKAASVIDVGYSVSEIVRGIEQVVSSGRRGRSGAVANPYAGSARGMVSTLIKEQLKLVELGEGLIKKQFHDLMVRP